MTSKGFWIPQISDKSKIFTLEREKHERERTLFRDSRELFEFPFDNKIQVERSDQRDCLPVVMFCSEPIITQLH